MPRLKADAKREILAKRRAEIDAQLKQIDARIKDTERKHDTRRKIIAGALALEHMEQNPKDAFSAKLRELLHDYVEPRSRALFPFLAPPKPKEAEISPEANKAEAAE